MIKIPHAFLINSDGTTTELTSDGPIKDILKTGECYVIVSDDVRKVFLWKGVKSSVRSKFIGARRSQEIRGQVGMYHAVVPLDEGEEDPEFIKLIGGQTEAGIAKEIEAAEVSAPSVHPLREKNIFGTPRPAKGMNIAGGQLREKFFRPSYATLKEQFNEKKDTEIHNLLDRIEELEDTIMKLEALIPDEDNKKKSKKQQATDSKLAIQLDEKDRQIRELKNNMGFLRKEKVQLQQQLERIKSMSNDSSVIRVEDLRSKPPLNALTKDLQEKINKQQSLISKLRRELITPISQTTLSNKDRILELLKKKALTSNDIADKLGLSKQDTRTYLLRLKQENKIKTLGKKGRYYIYTYKKPSDTAILSFKDEISKKISELEAKVNTIASKPTKFREEEFIELQKPSFYRGNEEGIENFETPSNQKIQPPFNQMLELPVDQLDGTLQTLLATIPELKAATIVSTEGKPIASALPHGVDESKLANMMVPLLSLAEKAIIEMKQGEFEQLYVKGKEGYLLVLPAGPNAVLSVSTTKDPRLGLIFLDCKRTCEKIAKLI